MSRMEPNPPKKYPNSFDASRDGGGDGTFRPNSAAFSLTPAAERPDCIDVFKRVHTSSAVIVCQSRFPTSKGHEKIFRHDVPARGQEEWQWLTKSLSHLLSRGPVAWYRRSEHTYCGLLSRILCPGSRFIIGIGDGVAESAILDWKNEGRVDNTSASHAGYRLN